MPENFTDFEATRDSEESTNSKTKPGRESIEPEIYGLESEIKIKRWKNLLKMKRWPDGNPIA